MSRPITTLILGGALVLMACESHPPLAPDSVRPARASAAAPAAALPGPGATVLQRAELPVQPPDGPFHLVHAILDFQPGTWFPAHVHGGPGLYTVVDGVISLAREGAVSEVRAGESYIQETGQVVAAGNLEESPALMAVAFAMPEGEELVTFHPDHDDDPALPPPAFADFRSSAALARAAPFSIVQLVVRLEPGASTPLHAQPGPSLYTLLDGEAVLTRPGREEEAVTAGGAWTLQEGEPARLRTPAGARFVATYLVPREEALGGA